VLMSLWSFQGARGPESPPAENTAVTDPRLKRHGAGRTDPSKLNSALADRFTEVRRSA